MAYPFDAILVVKGPARDLNAFATSSFRPHTVRGNPAYGWPARSPIERRRLSAGVIRYDWNYKYPSPRSWVWAAAGAFPTLELTLIVCDDLEESFWMGAVQGDRAIREEAVDRVKMGKLSDRAFFDYLRRTVERWLREAGCPPSGV